MNAANEAISHRTIFPVILRIVFSLLLWTFGFASMNLLDAQTDPHRVVKNYPVDRAKLEHLQRWVNAGHDTWCRDPKLVAFATLDQVAPEFTSSQFELASLPTERFADHGTTFIYTFSTLDGRTSYQITVRRYRWLLSAAGTMEQMVWAPVSIETVTHRTTD
jgi:hypothetical protein